jgi:dihydroneopterin aldolase
MDIVNVRGIRLRANHGCLEEEAIIGGDYVVNVQLHGNFEAAAKSDNLTDAADYVTVYNIVKAEMKIRSKLIEHVAERIAISLKKALPNVAKLSVEVIKKNPPVGGEVDEVSIVIEK